MGGYAMVFDGPRSTPQLSFTIRNRFAHAGVVITASHNPYHDNGFKAYFSDGAQLVAPHDKGVVSAYSDISFSEIMPWLEDGALPRGSTLPSSDDLAYKGALEDAVLNPKLAQRKSSQNSLYSHPWNGSYFLSARTLGPWSQCCPWLMSRGHPIQILAASLPQTLKALRHFHWP